VLNVFSFGRKQKTENKDKKGTALLIVDHVFRRSTKLLVTFDDFIHSIKEVFLRHSLPAGSDCIHPCFCADTPYVSSCNYSLMSEMKTKQGSISPGAYVEHKNSINLCLSQRWQN